MGIGKVRPAVEALASYKPGKAASQAEEEHGITGAIKLASNENPYQPLPSVLAALAGAAHNVNRYGDHRATELRIALAKWIGVEPGSIGVGCGSAGILQQLCLAFVDPGDEVVYPWPSFEAYPINVHMMGGISVNPPLVDHRFDMDALANAVTSKTKLVFLATPNNPTGTAISTDEVATFLDRIPDDVVVMVDEAYREFSDPAFGDPVADLLPRYRNVMVTRTFSKAYGLAGLRLGYAIADPDLITEADKMLLAFSVNSMAQAGAMAALEALDEVAPRVQAILAERARVVNALGSAGWELPDAQANFVYIALGDRTESVALGLEKQGIVVRPFPGVGMRVTIGSPEENDRFLRAFEAVSQ